MSESRITTQRPIAGTHRGSVLASLPNGFPHPRRRPVNTDHAALSVQDAAPSFWTIDELSLLVSRNGNPSETLTNIVTLIRQRFRTDVCSVYLLEPDRANLVLAATVGLRPESVGQVRMRVTEGLAGLVAEQVTPVVVPDATAHPRFK